MTPHEIHTTILAALESIRKVEPEALATLIEKRVWVGKDIESDDVMAVPDNSNPEQLTLGLLGVINGICIALGLPRIAAVYDTDDPSQLLRFQALGREAAAR